MLLAFSPNLQKRWTISRFWRGLSAVNDCSAHDWGQTARQEGKICSHFRAFTSLVSFLVNSANVRTNQPQSSEIGLKDRTRRNSFAPYRLWSGSFQARNGNLLCIF